MDSAVENTSPGQDRYIDRDFSWLAFNRRVLAEARSAENPLLERLKFLSIVASNLDEFFEVRLAGLLQKVESYVPVDGIADLDCREKLTGLLRIVHAMVAQQYRCWNDELIPKLGAKGIHVLGLQDLGPHEIEQLGHRFRKEIYPLLTPIKVDPAHPFPWVLNKALCLGAWLEDDRPGHRGGLGVVAIPRCLPRVLSLSGKDKGHRFVFLYDVIKLFMEDLFRGYRISGLASFRVPRNSNLYMTEDASNLLDSVEAVVHNRRKGNVVRLEIDEDTPARIRKALMENFGLEPQLVFSVPGPVNLNRLMGLYQLAPMEELKFPPHSPHSLTHAGEPQDMFARLRERDLLLHHPYDSFDPVIDFIRGAARDPEVLCIKQTLYRTSAESPVMYALLEAAELGKEVTAVVELQARFDEKSNINWARQLQDSGGTVVYGLVGLKTHCKLSLVLRSEAGGGGLDDRIRRYAHVGTGNYHPETAKHYTDLSLLTADPEITESISGVFNYLTSHSKNPQFPNLLVGPVNLLAETLRLIRAEESSAREGRPSGIWAKMNALIDPDVIDALYQASGAGVQIRLMVRGICSLRPGIKGLSENRRKPYRVHGQRRLDDAQPAGTRRGAGARFGSGLAGPPGADSGCLLGGQLEFASYVPRRWLYARQAQGRGGALRGPGIPVGVSRGPGRIRTRPPASRRGFSWSPARPRIPPRRTPCRSGTGILPGFGNLNPAFPFRPRTRESRARVRGSVYYTT
ncbi:MAG: polyphosphate kinase 1 [Fibrobacterota bacterium]|nr:polyphosphate kinase 1 [Fibrobacterota bacterium]